jgi:hypothetical protein
VTATAPIPLHGCRHDEIDVDALLADDRLAAALAAPIIPGTEKSDLQLWLVRAYRRVHGNNATTDGACALLHRHPLASGNHLCAVAKFIWARSDEQEPLTDIGNARRLATLCGTDITHDPATGWRIWAESCWQGDPDGTVVQRWAKNVSRLVHEEANAQYRELGMT